MILRGNGAMDKEHACCIGGLGLIPAIGELQFQMIYLPFWSRVLGRKVPDMTICELEHFQSVEHIKNINPSRGIYGIHGARAWYGNKKVLMKN